MAEKKVSGAGLMIIKEVEQWAWILRAGCSTLELAAIIKDPRILLSMDSVAGRTWSLDFFDFPKTFSVRARKGLNWMEAIKLATSFLSDVFEEEEGEWSEGRPWWPSLGQRIEEESELQKMLIYCSQNEHEHWVEDLIRSFRLQAILLGLDEMTLVAFERTVRIFMRSPGEWVRLPNCSQKAIGRFSSRALGGILRITPVVVCESV